MCNVPIELNEEVLAAFLCEYGDIENINKAKSSSGFQPEFRRWISMMYHNPQAVVQVNGRRSRVFAIERSVRQGCPLSPLLYVLALEPLLRSLRDEGTSPSLRGIPFAGPLTARVSAFADDISLCIPSSGYKGYEEGG